MKKVNTIHGDICSDKQEMKKIEMLMDSMNLDDIDLTDPLFQTNDAMRSYAQLMDAYPRLSQEKQDKTLLLLKKTNDPELRELLIYSNLRLVFNLLKNWYAPNAFDKADIIETGVEGLIRAIDKYDPTCGYQFSTYAGTVIKNTVAQELRDSMNRIKFSKDAVKLMKSFYRKCDAIASEQNCQEWYRNPLILKEALAEFTDDENDKILSWLCISKDEWIQSFSQPISQEGDNEITLEDTVADPDGDVLSVVMRGDGLSRKEIIKIGERAQLTHDELTMALAHEGLTEEMKVIGDDRIFFQTIANVYGWKYTYVLSLRNSAKEKVQNLVEENPVRKSKGRKEPAVPKEAAYMAGKDSGNKELIVPAGKNTKVA